MKLRSYLVVDRRNGDTYQVWAESTKSAQRGYERQRCCTWKKEVFRLVRLLGEMEVEDTCSEEN